MAQTVGGATAGNQGRLEPSLRSSRCSVFAFTAGQRVSARVRWKCRNSWRRTVGSVSGSGILFPNSLSFVLHPGSHPASLPPPSSLPPSPRASNNQGFLRLCGYRLWRSVTAFPRGLFSLSDPCCCHFGARFCQTSHSDFNKLRSSFQKNTF